jgi:flagellar biosynthesis/type III secretory pathway chaperone
MSEEIEFNNIMKIGDQLKQKGYQILIHNNCIQIFLKTAFDTEIKNRINEIKAIINQTQKIKNIEKLIQVKNILHENKYLKVIEINFNP